MADNETFHFAPHVVAGMLDLAPQTVRRWAEYHREHLSEGANPEPGTPRGFTYTDVETLKKIKELRAIGLPAAVINTRLSEETIKPTNALPTDVSLLNDSTNALEELPQAPGLTLVLQDVVHRLAALEASRQEDRRDRIDRLTMLGLGICIGLLFAVGMIVLGWIYGAG